MNEPLTTRQVATEISQSPDIEGSVEEWQIRRIFEDGTLAEPTKFGGKRMISPNLIPEIIAALRARRWLPCDNEGPSDD